MFIFIFLTFLSIRSDRAGRRLVLVEIFSSVPKLVKSVNSPTFSAIFFFHTESRLVKSVRLKNFILPTEPNLSEKKNVPPIAHC